MSSKKLSTIIRKLATLIQASGTDGVNMGNGLLYFGIKFEDYHYDEDKNAEGDEDADERVQAFRAVKDPEMEYAAELGAMFSKALGRRVSVQNEGHNNYELVCKISIGSEAELAKAIDAVQRADTTDIDGILVSQDIPYMSAVQFSYTPVDKMGQMNIDWSDLIDWVDEYEKKSKPKTASAPKAKVVLWMRANAKDYVDRKTGEVNYTGLAEGAASEFDMHDALDSETHWIWDAAIAAGDAYEKKSR